MSNTVSNNIKDDEYREYIDDPKVVEKKVDELARLVRKHKGRVVFFTGAGISTGAGIPDFRSGVNSVTGMPAGKWCKDATSNKWDDDTKKENRNRREKTTSALCAIPTKSHMGLCALKEAGFVRGLISQNCDGLHRRSGFDKSSLAELHGNTNLEVCGWCGQEYFRDFSTYRGRHGPGVELKRKLWPKHRHLDLINPRKGNHYTGRRCTKTGCDGYLFDSTIDFGDNLPEKHISRGYKLAKEATICIVLGSRCSVSPACDMPISVGRSGRDLVVVNLQHTQADDSASLRIGAKIDDVMVPLMKKLGVKIPNFRVHRKIRIKRVSDKMVTVSSYDVEGSHDVVPNDAIWCCQVSNSSSGKLMKDTLFVKLNQDAGMSTNRSPGFPDQAIVRTFPWDNTAYPGMTDIEMVSGSCKGQVFAVTPDIVDVQDGTRMNGLMRVVNAGSRTGSQLEHRISLSGVDSRHCILMFRAHYGELPIRLPIPSSTGAVSHFDLFFDPMSRNWSVNTLPKQAGVVGGGGDKE